MPEVSRRRALAYVAALLVVLVVAGRFVEGGGDPRPKPVEPARVAALTPEAAGPRKLVVHVAGAVRRPGLYELTEGSRVDDAIRKAGGAKPRAALAGINLASPVADGQQVLVPQRAAGAGGGATGGAASAAGRGAGGRVRLNTATLEDLDALPGIGPITAQKILDYRQENGAFASVDELDAVPGIGPATLEELRELVDL